MNVALYGRPARWAMTERGEHALLRSAECLQIGPSSMSWNASELVVDLAERAVPHLTSVRGRVRLIPEVRSSFATALDDEARHYWRPFAPRARVEVRFERPGLDWSGTGYFDGNFGERALEMDFRRWSWSRSAGPDGASVLYDVLYRDGNARTLAMRFGQDGRPDALPPPPQAGLPRTFWRIAQSTRSDAGTKPRLLTRMEDAPFYARNAVETTLWGDRTTGVHETLDLGRFNTKICHLMLPFRMPRRG